MPSSPRSTSRHRLVLEHVLGAEHLAPLARALGRRVADRLLPLPRRRRPDDVHRAELLALAAHLVPTAGRAFDLRGGGRLRAHRLRGSGQGAAHRARGRPREGGRGRGSRTARARRRRARSSRRAARPSPHPASTSRTRGRNGRSRRRPPAVPTGRSPRPPIPEACAWRGSLPCPAGGAGTMGGGSPRRLGVGMGAMTSPPVPPANRRAPRPARGLVPDRRARRPGAPRRGCGREERPSEAPADERPDPVEAGPPTRHLPHRDDALLGGRHPDDRGRRALPRLAPRSSRGARDQGARTRDLEPGEAVRVEWGIAPAERPSGGPSPGAGPASRPRGRSPIDCGTASTTTACTRRSSSFGRRSPSPWVRVATATIPVSPRPFPQDGVALAAVGVADLASHAGLSLVLEPTPAILGAPAGTPADALQLACLWVRVAPR